MPLVIDPGGSTTPPVSSPIGITLPPPSPPTASPTLGSAPTVSSTPGAGQGVALTEAGFIPADATPVSSHASSLSATTTNPTLGAGSSATGKITRIGRWVFGYANIVFGSSGVAAGSGSYRVLLPVAAASPFSVVGSVMLFDSSAGVVRSGVLQALSGGLTAQMIIDAGVVSDAVPWVWAASDEIRFAFSYETAAPAT